MSVVIEIGESLARALSGAKGWRFTIRSAHSVRVGIDDNRLGGAYSPPRSQSEISGGVFIIWQDGSCSRGKIDSRTIHRLPQNMEMWRSLAYRDDDAAYIAELAPPTSVELVDPRIGEVASGSSTSVFETLAEIASAAREGGAEVIDAQAGCSASETIVATSRGLWVKYPETMAWCEWDLDKTFGDSRLGRSLESWQALERSVSGTAERAMASKTVGSLPSRDMTVLLAPEVADSFIGHYLASNMNGEAVAERRSRYSLDQFRSGDMAFRHDLDLLVDTVIPFGSGSSPCTPEGIPSGRAALAEGGRLVTPILDAKYSRRCGMAPTPVPAAGLSAGHAGMLLCTRQMEAWQDMMHGACDSLLVSTVLGMHTQDPATGNFSLAAPDSILIRDGRFAGAVKAVISGNFFDALQADGSRFGLDSDHPNPGIALNCHVEAGPAE
ncbi:MAG: metallopeptidase TldD-related protein [Clostridia bacterium]|nr:metallopeptidase TldD-related protein [Clostridia bacterium]